MNVLYAVFAPFYIYIFFLFACTYPSLFGAFSMKLWTLICNKLWAYVKIHGKLYVEHVLSWASVRGHNTMHNVIFLTKWRNALSVNRGMLENRWTVYSSSSKITISSECNTQRFMLFCFVLFCFLLNCCNSFSRYRATLEERKKIDDLRVLATCRSGTLGILSSDLTWWSRFSWKHIVMPDMAYGGLWLIKTPSFQACHLCNFNVHGRHSFRTISTYDVLPYAMMFIPYAMMFTQVYERNWRRC